jgi:BirA family biotin operon repressor/biotin-[acetyl-CoA-carboxylase] ligase
MFDPLPPDLALGLQRAAPQLGGFGRLRYCVETDSTNDLALALATSGEPEGTAVLADMQRAGRGRRGRGWFSPPEAGLYLSTVVRPSRSTGAVALITLAAGVAAATAVHGVTSLPVELKWPNDLVIGRPWRKLGGVLCETSGHGTRIDAVVIGIGINLLHAAYPREIADRATSIETELGRPIDRAPLVVALLAALRRVMEQLHANATDRVCDEWRRLAHVGLSGAPVRWMDPAGERTGRARDIDRDGALLVDTADGVARVIAGEVLWEGLSRG